MKKSRGLSRSIDYINNLTKEDICIFFLVIISFFSSNPYFTWSWSGMSYFVFICCLLVPLWKKQPPLYQYGIFDNKLKRVGIFFIGLFYFLACFNQYEPINMNGMLFIIAFIGLFMIDNINWRKAYDYYFTLFAITLVPSLLVYFAVFWGGVHLPYRVLDPLVEAKDYYYYAYPFCVIASDLSAVRFEGMYDEPGVVGTICGALLLSNKCNFKDWRSWVLLVGGIFSLSMFFYAMIAYYALVHAGKKMKLWMLILFVVAGATIYKLDNTILDDFVFSRFVFEDGHFAGDNRGGNDAWFDNYIHSSKSMVGYGSGYASKVQYPGGASFRFILVDMGWPLSIIFCLGMLLYYKSVIGKRAKYKDYLLAIIIFVGIMYQRPFIFNLFYVFLMIIPAHRISELSNDRVRESINI